jgi:hypothetical protein
MAWLFAIARKGIHALIHNTLCCIFPCAVLRESALEILETEACEISSCGMRLAEPGYRYLIRQRLLPLQKLVSQLALSLLGTTL